MSLPVVGSLCSISAIIFHSIQFTYQNISCWDSWSVSTSCQYLIFFFMFLSHKIPKPCIIIHTCYRRVHKLIQSFLSSRDRDRNTLNEQFSKSYFWVHSTNQSCLLKLNVFPDKGRFGNKIIRIQNVILTKSVLMFQKFYEDKAIEVFEKRWFVKQYEWQEKNAFLLWQ